MDRTILLRLRQMIESRIAVSTDRNRMEALRVLFRAQSPDQPVPFPRFLEVLQTYFPACSSQDAEVIFRGSRGKGGRDLDLRKLQAQLSPETLTNTRKRPSSVPPHAQRHRGMGHYESFNHVRSGLHKYTAPKEIYDLNSRSSFLAGDSTLQRISQPLHAPQLMQLQGRAEAPDTWVTASQGTSPYATLRAERVPGQHLARKVDQLVNAAYHESVKARSMRHSDLSAQEAARAAVRRQKRPSTAVPATFKVGMEMAATRHLPTDYTTSYMRSHSRQEIGYRNTHSTSKGMASQQEQTLRMATQAFESSLQMRHRQSGGVP